MTNAVFGGAVEGSTAATIVVVGTDNNTPFSFPLSAKADHDGNADDVVRKNKRAKVRVTPALMYLDDIFLNVRLKSLIQEYYK